MAPLTGRVAAAGEDPVVHAVARDVAPPSPARVLGPAARRLLPALLVLVVVVARATLDPGELRGPRGDALAAQLDAANWRTVAHGSDHFAQTAPPSLLRHTWSLGIEEQFHLAVPATGEVTLSAAELRYSALLAERDDATVHSGVDRPRAELEIAETAAVAHLGRTFTAVAALRDGGMHVCLEEFGTGPAPLAGRHEIPVDTVKMTSLSSDGSANLERVRRGRAPGRRGTG